MHMLTHALRQPQTVLYPAKSQQTFTRQQLPASQCPEEVHAGDRSALRCMTCLCPPSTCTRALAFSRSNEQHLPSRAPTKKIGRSHRMDNQHIQQCMPTRRSVTTMSMSQQGARPHNCGRLAQRDGAVGTLPMQSNPRPTPSATSALLPSLCHTNDATPDACGSIMCGFAPPIACACWPTNRGLYAATYCGLYCIIVLYIAACSRTACTAAALAACVSADCWCKNCW
mmetsp:Transcript_20185/g.59930  ORF Transcript_20185/g.59930 Transcript_20185/m.59930 type:complete len:227 (+) Transcript_20185:1080-1760(+)